MTGPNVLVTDENTTNGYDGLEVECPDCNRTHYLFKIIESETRDCDCGATLGPLELNYEP